MLLVAAVLAAVGTIGSFRGGAAVDGSSERASAPTNGARSGPSGSDLVLGLDGERRSAPSSGDASVDEHEPVDDALWSPAARALGVSFIAAFAVGVASRLFLRVALAGLGVAALLLLGLERSGFVDIHWSALEAQSGGLTGWIAAQTESLRSFVTGSLPSGAAAATGFFLGFRRR